MTAAAADGGGAKPELTAEQEAAEAATQREPWSDAAWTAFASSASGTDAEPWVLEQLLAQFPTSAHYWARLAELHMTHKRWAAAEAVFDRCLPTCPRISLWKLYLVCVRESRLGADSTLPPHRGRAQLKEKYHYVLEEVGASRHADSIWLDFVALLLAEPQVSPMEVRAVFQRAVVVPMEQLDTVWQRYTAFEKEQNEAMAAKHLERLQPKVNAARAVLRDRKLLMDGIVPVNLPTPPTGTREEAKQLGSWQRLIEYEKENPERLSAREELKSRMRNAYKHFLCSFRHFPEVWHDFAAYEARDDVDTACLVLRSAMAVLPRCQLLGFAYAELEEQRGRLEEARSVYDRLLVDSPHPAVWIQLMRFARRTGGQAAGRDVFKSARKSEHCTHHVWAASALMERDANEQHEVARKVFEKGLSEEGFAAQPDYVEAYVSFLESMRADGTKRTNNLRALFEKALQQLPPDRSRVIWRRYLDLEYRSAVGGGDVSTAMQLEDRYAEAFPDDAPERRLGMFRLLHRYRTMDLLPGSEDDEAYLRRYPALLREDCEHAQRVVPPALAAAVGGSAAAAVRGGGAVGVASGGAGAAAPPPSGRAGGVGRGRGMGMGAAAGGAGITRGAVAAAPTPALGADVPEAVNSFFMRLPPASRAHLSGPVPDADKVLRTLREKPLPARPEDPAGAGKRSFDGMGGHIDVFMDRQKRGKF